MRVIKKTFIADIENHYADYKKLRSRLNQLRDDESLYRSLMVTMGPIGSAVSSYLSKKPTESDIREVLKILGEYPKATRPDSSMAGTNKPPSQPAVQTGMVSSNQIDEQKDGMKTNGPKPNETDSIASEAEIVACETDPGKKMDPSSLPIRPPSMRKEKRLLG
jgi:hypothetical protein